MMRLPLLALLGSAAITTVALAAPVLPPLPRLLTERGVLARPAAAPGATITYGDSPAQKIELFLPKSDKLAANGRLPVVVMLAGRCWNGGDAALAVLRPMAGALVDRGYAVWSIGYRGLADDGGYPATFEDVAAAIDRIATDAEAHGLDPNRVLLFGHGAGATLALWAAGRRQIPQSSPLASGSPLVPRAVLAADGFGAIGKSIDAACGSGTAERLGAPRPAADAEATPDTAAPGAFADVSPVALLPTHVPAVLLYGVYDDVAPPAVGLAYATAARRAGDSVDLQLAPVAGHFEVLSPGTAASAQALAAIDRLLR